ncbi:MAG: glycosyltransferase, partial [Clostridia bacterium]|nr:glycosyltransferase [Clostridia bacterium]
DDANMLKGALVYSDKISTVSNTYAGEIKTAEYGEYLDPVIRYHHMKLCGIVNGIDYDIWNPETDTKIARQFGVADVIEGKKANKRALQEELGLEVDENKFLIALISRLTDQKGLDLINAVFEQFLDGNTQFVLIGTGDSYYEDMFRYYENAHKGTVSSNIMYSDDRAHKVYAAADAFLVPSRFEPCGLTQLISFRYGSIPIVRETGGLKDTVQPYNWTDGSGNGFSFDQYRADLLLNSVNYAKTLYFTERDNWDAMVKRAMETDHSWNASAGEYIDLYNSLLG